jgi:uncharacterized protein
MNITVTGASGFVGTALMASLLAAGNNVRALSLRKAIPPDALAECNAVVHLAGEPVAQRWSDDAKQRIRTSRIDATRALVQAMAAHRPQVLISASAVGYYGSCGDGLLTEASPAAGDFLGALAAEWEQEAAAATAFGTRVVHLRIGVVLGKGGALAKMLPAFRMGLGGPIGGGAQWMSWIHVDDLVGLIQFLLADSTLRGPFNAVSPHPVTNADFARALGLALHRPAIVPMPVFVLKLMFGEMAQVILASQRVIPQAATRAGFPYRYADLDAALQASL